MSTSGTVVQCLRSSCQSPNPKEIHCFKRGMCVQFSHFNLRQVFQEHKPGKKQDLPVHYLFLVAPSREICNEQFLFSLYPSNSTIIRHWFLPTLGKSCPYMFPHSLARHEAHLHLLVLCIH
jgi:hypothetical protein